MVSTGRMRFLYALNVVIPGLLSVIHLASPADASKALWGGSANAAALSPPLALPMLGSWWAAVAILSLLGLGSPLKYSPLMLMQTLYKIVFLSSAILPLALAGRWSDIPTTAVAPYAAYLIPLAFCTPWGYLLGGGGATRGKAE